MIISQLDEINDLKACMLSSKYIRDLMFKSSKIMRKIPFRFKFETKKDQISQFLSEKGRYIKKITFISSDYNFFVQKRGTIEPNLISYILNYTINLEDFTCSVIDLRGLIPYDKNVITPFDLPKLKHLSITSEMIHYIKNAKNIDGLETLTLSHIYTETAADFLCRQNNLKSLTIEHELTLCKEIASNVKFSLTKLEFRSESGRKSSSNFLNFFETQTESLRELKINRNFDECFCEQLFEIIIRCKKLEKFRIEFCIILDWLNHENLGQFLYNIKYFESCSLDLKKAYSIFPNLTSLKCHRWNITEGTYDKLEKLEIGDLNCCEIQNCKFPNLKILIIESVDEDYYWKRCERNIPKLEHFKLNKITTFSTFLIFSERLKSFKNLKLFEMNSSDTDYKIIVNVKSKIIETSRYFFHERKEIFDAVKKNFENFTYNFFKNSRIPMIY